MDLKIKTQSQKKVLKIKESILQKKVLISLNFRQMSVNKISNMFLREKNLYQKDILPKKDFLNTDKYEKFPKKYN